MFVPAVPAGGGGGGGWRCAGGAGLPRARVLKGAGPPGPGPTAS